MLVIMPTKTAMGTIIMSGNPDATITPKNRKAPTIMCGRHHRCLRERFRLKRK
jgi:hypothetical protein